MSDCKSVFLVQFHILLKKESSCVEVCCHRWWWWSTLSWLHSCLPFLPSNWRGLCSACWQRGSWFWSCCCSSCSWSGLSHSCLGCTWLTKGCYSCARLTHCWQSWPWLKQCCSGLRYCCSRSSCSCACKWIDVILGKASWFESVWITAGQLSGAIQSCPCRRSLLLSCRIPILFNHQ